MNVPANATIRQGCRSCRAVNLLAGLWMLALWSAAVFGSEAGQGTALFEDQATLAVTISAPWQRFLRDVDSDERYPAVLEYRTPDGHSGRIPVTVERRGLTRRSLCGFPPIRIRLDRSATPGTLFEGQRSLKMVTHCNNGRRWEQYYVLELLAYRIYNRVTEQSFRVRALAINYRDDELGRDDPGRFAFLIEHARDVADRNGLERVRRGLIRPADYPDREMGHFMLFQYLIGNTDWSVWTASEDERCCHNVRVIGKLDAGRLYAVPYDFDSSGLVDASYAVPPDHLPIRRVSDRIYRGFCHHNAGLDDARLTFLALEDEILALIGDEPLLNSRNRHQALRYLQAFFQTLESPDRFERRIIAQCRR